MALCGCELMSEFDCWAGFSGGKGEEEDCGLRISDGMVGIVGGVASTAAESGGCMITEAT